MLYLIKDNYYKGECTNRETDEVKTYYHDLGYECATFITQPKCHERYVATSCEKMDKDDNGEVLGVKLTVAELKEFKLAELSDISKSFEDNVNKQMYFISSVHGYRINGDRRTRSNLQDLIAYQPTDNVIYRDYDNQERTLTKEQLQVILKEHVVNGEAIYHQKWAFEAKINACTTIEELNAIEIKFTMHDFNKGEVVADE